MAITDGLRNNPNLYDFLIIGGGPAGLTAAVYGARAGMKVGFLEKDTPGGKMVKTGSLENYPGFETIGGADLSLKMMNHALANEVSYIYGHVTKVVHLDPYWAVHTADEKIYYAKTVFVATGMIERKLGIPNETEYYGRGVSYCAVCDAALYKKRDVAVIGGGNSAVEEAIYLSNVVNKVHVIHRRNEFRADAKIVANMKKIDNIILHTPAVALSIEVADNVVNGITIQNTETQKTELIPIACVFPYVGLNPVTDFVKDLAIVGNDGFIMVNDKMETKYKGLYAGGDVIQKDLRQVATAINDGAIAAIEAKNYIANHFVDRD
ncbi:thioredoxin reductase (NADPH) [Mycoplasmoides fastidiosum]|uniref:Thioredoxin reductase (NADPH) n=2 Tax=Mycoplasmoides fastidiosum TaxID=92758 RepID=A0ABU0LY84_9BACT|nr:FAD-dependent oxidoreductase [Mycoplasmoides fastidiosum]MDQ0513568.1 thioredoxin reductase (NADPH) [Mycoplasmoides fastidiosum]